jgi:hypothetical protein
LAEWRGALRDLLGLRGPRPWIALSVLAVLALVGMWWWMTGQTWHDDSYAFWSAWNDGKLYPPHWEPVSAYVYSPTFAQAFWPLTRLPWPVVNSLWAALQIGALVWMLRPVGAVAALLVPWPFLAGSGTAVFATINNGNPMILTAAALTLGLSRWPGAFAFVLLTKVSAGIGILWFAVRREWRKLAIAIGTTVVLVLISLPIAPHLWVQWVRLLAGAATSAGGSSALDKEIFLPVPIAVRGTIGLAVVLVASWRRIRWIVPLGCFLALPDIHLGGFAVLAAVPAVYWRDHPGIGGDLQDGAQRLVARWRPRRIAPGERASPR